MTADAYASYIEARYQGEVFGEAMFGLLAEARADPEEARKLRTLAQLERETKEVLLPEVEAVGRPSTPDQKRIEQGRELSEHMGEVPWRDFLTAMRSELASLVEQFRDAEALAPSGKEALLRHVTAHEQALLDFTTLELDAAPEADSLAPVVALLRQSTPIRPAE